MASRADRIFEILRSAGGRLAVCEVVQALAEQEGVAVEELRTRLPSCLGQDNKSRVGRGEAKRFKLFAEGDEVRGFISLVAPPAEDEPLARPTAMEDAPSNISRAIEEANAAVKQQLRAEIRRLHWREFESAFLVQVLEATGFKNIEITRATRDGGVDAICEFKIGLLKSRALVSAKHWGDDQRVGVKEVRELRGNEEHADALIIITSASFTSDAIAIAARAPGQRSVTLIDMDAIVDVCFENNIGACPIRNVPVLKSFVGLGGADGEAPDSSRQRNGGTP